MTFGGRSGLALAALAIMVTAATAEEDIATDFLLTLNESSELAMRDRLNIEEIPSTVTVVRREEILHSGAKTLLDVLRLVPGIGISMSTSGKRQIVLRGVRSKYRDKIKLLINGVDVTNNLYSNQFYYYDFPAALIKRVEITKTPDAILYGSNAFMGVINVVTLDMENKNRVTAMATDDKRAGSTLFVSLPLGGGRLDLDAHYSRFNPDVTADPVQRRKRKTHEITVVRDAMEAYTLERTLGTGVRYKNGGWQLLYRLQRYEKGNFFGVADLTPLKHDQGVTMTHHSAQLGYEAYLTPALKWHLHAEVKDYTWDGSFRTVPIDFAADELSNDPDNDIIMGAYVHEVESGALGYLRYRGGLHNATLQLEGHYAKPVKMYYLQYVPALGAEYDPIFNIGPQGARLTGENNILKEGIDRSWAALALEDMVALDDALSVVMGVRYDRYSDFNGHFSYKLGGVYRVGRNDTFKLLYNHTFRAPSWTELYANAGTEFHGNPDLKPETMDMLELNWLHRFDAGAMLKLNLYYGWNDDPIIRGLDRYVNGESLTLRGAEVSFRWEPDDRIGWVTSASYAYAYVDNPSCVKQRRSEEVRFRSWLDFALLPSLHSFTKIEYRNEDETVGTEPTQIEAWTTVDQIFTWRRGDWVLQGGVTNLFDEKVRYEAMPSDPVGGYVFIPQSRSIPGPGREWFVALQWEW